MHYLSKMGVGFLHQQCYVLMFKSVRVSLVHLLPCYVKSVAVTITKRDCKGRTSRYGLACVSSYSVLRIKGERRHYCLLLV